MEADVRQRNFVKLPSHVSTNGALAALICALLLLLSALLNTRRKSATKAKTVLLIGPMGSGKTMMWCRLMLGHTPPTFTSAAENEGTLRARWHKATEEELDITGEVCRKSATKDLAQVTQLPAHLRVTPPIHLLDVPGHPRLRTRTLGLSLPAAEGIVLTTTTDLRSTREAADHLLLLFALLSVRQARNPKAKMPKLLIFITKTDLLPSLSSTDRVVTRVQNALEREFERRKADAAVASSARLEGLEAPAATGFSSVFKSRGKSEDLPLDEVELLNSEVAAEVPDWETLGVKVSWASGNSTTPGGLRHWWDWADALL